RWIMSEETEYKYLGPWRGSNYKQYFYKHRKIRADTLYGPTVGEDAQTLEEVAADYDIPVAAVYEAIHYCTHHQDVLQQDYDRELEDIRSHGWDKPPYVPADFKPDE